MVQFTLYIEKNTFIHRLDPRTKLLWLACVFAWSLTFNDPSWTLIIFLLVFSFAVASKTLSGIRYAIPGMISLFVMCSLMWPFFRPGYTLLLRIGSYPLYYESVLYGVAVGIRICAMVLSGLILFATTRVEDLLAALCKMRLPYSVAFGISTIFRFIPTMMGEGNIIILAQEARGLNLRTGSLLEKAKNSVPIMAPLLILTLRKAEELSMAVESRAFRAKPTRSFLYTPKITKKDVTIMILLLTITVFFLYLRWMGHGAILPTQI